MRIVTIVAAVTLFALLLSGCAMPTGATIEQPSGSAPAAGEAVRAGDVARSNSANTSAAAATAQPAVTTDVQPISFVGPIEALPAGGLIGRWQVGGRTVEVNTGTNIDQTGGPAALGTQVGVQGWERSDGVIEAGWILVQVGGTPGGIVTIPATATPAATASAAATPAATTPPGANATVTAAVASGDGIPGATRRPTAAVGGTPLPPARTRVGMPLEFRGFVETAPSGTNFVGQWVVSGRRVNVSAGTRITQQHGELVKGAYVQVHGWVQADGSINAAYVMTKKDNVSDDDKSVKLKWQGRIDQLPASGTAGIWIVNGLRVLVDSNTDIKPKNGSFIVGAEIEVTGTVAANGDLRAEKIRLAGKEKAEDDDKNDKDDKGTNPGKGKASDSNPGKGKGNDK